MKKLKSKIIKNFLKNKISIKEITLASFFMVLIIISKLDIFTINLGIMRIGLSYIFLISVGIISRFAIGIITVILGDTFGILINGNIGLWHYSYFLIPIAIFLICYFLKFIFKIKNPKIIVLANLIIFTIMFVVLFVVMVLENDFIKKSNNPETNIDFTNKILKILVWVMFCLILIGSFVVSFLYLKYKSNKLKDYLVINIIVSIIIIVMIWFYGPLAQILWLSDQYGKNYWNSYAIFQIPRIIKTPVILPIYNFIIVSIYKIYKQIKSVHYYTW